MALIYDPTTGEYYETASNGTRMKYQKADRTFSGPTTPDEMKAYGAATMAQVTAANPATATTVPVAAAPAATSTAQTASYYKPENYDPEGWAAGKYNADGTLKEEYKYQNQPGYDPSSNPDTYIDQSYLSSRLTPTEWNAQRTPATTTPAAPAFPVTTTPAATTPTTQQQSTDALLNSILAMLQENVNAEPYQNTESYTPSTSTGQVSQALTDKILESLSKPAGYTAPEQQAIYDRAMNTFNANQNTDLRTLQNLYETLGIRSQAGDLGGEAGSSLQDYMGKRSIAQADLLGNIAQQIADTRMQDQQNTIANAKGVMDSLYGQDRGNFADALSLSEFNQNVDNDQFNRTFAVAQFINDANQQDVANAMADREYWQSTTGISAESALGFLQSMNQSELSALAAGVGMEESALLPILVGLAMGAIGGDKEGTTTGDLLEVAGEGGKWAWDAAKKTWGWVADKVGGSEEEPPVSPEDAGWLTPFLTKLGTVAVPLAATLGTAYMLYKNQQTESVSKGGRIRDWTNKSGEYNPITAYAVWDWAENGAQWNSAAAILEPNPEIFTLTNAAVKSAIAQSAEGMPVEQAAALARDQAYSSIFDYLSGVKVKKVYTNGQTDTVTLPASDRIAIADGIAKKIESSYLGASNGSIDYANWGKAK
jgi:hypothetical protein